MYIQKRNKFIDFFHLYILLSTIASHSLNTIPTFISVYKTDYLHILNRACSNVKFL